jgi:hypothetical protein
MILGALYSDILDDFEGVQSVYVLSIEFELYCSLSSIIRYSIYKDDNDVLAKSRNVYTRIGLALLRDESGDVYRRVGLARWLLDEVFKGITPVELRSV